MSSVRIETVARPDSIAERLFEPLDQLRWLVLKALGPAVLPLVRRRDLRVVLAGTLTVLVASALTLSVPWWLLALGPILWGVPHLIADVRYLVVRPGLHRRPRIWLAAGLPLAIAGCGVWSVPLGLTSAALVAVMADGPGLRKRWALAILFPLIGMAAWAGDLAQLVFAHLHNFIAVGLWWGWRPRSRPIHAFVPALLGVVSLAIGLGWLSPASQGLLWAPAGLGAVEHLGWLAPGLEEPWAGRLVLLFAFAQTVHYGVWLRLIPEEDRPQATPRTFAASFRALRTDMGPWILTGAAALAAGIAIWATFDLLEARAGYLRMALFHGYLEVAAAAFLFVEGRPQR